MKTLQRSILSVVALQAACATGEDTETRSLNDEFLDQAHFDARELPVLATEVVARYESGDTTLLFIARQPLGGEEGDVVIDIAEVGPSDAMTFTGALLAEGATPLEVLRQLSPDAPISAALRADHERIVRSQGRDSDEVREASTFRNGWNVTHDEEVCAPPNESGWFLFVEDMESRTSVADVEAVILTDSLAWQHRTVTIQAPTDSPNNVPVRVCNPETMIAGGCAFDRFYAAVFTYGPAGAATVWQDDLRDCDVLKYWWGSRDEDQIYGVQVSDAEEYYAGWVDCEQNGGLCDGLQAYIGVGLNDEW